LNGGERGEVYSNFWGVYRNSEFAREKLSDPAAPQKPNETQTPRRFRCNLVDEVLRNLYIMPAESTLRRIFAQLSRKQ